MLLSLVCNFGTDVNSIVLCCIPGFILQVNAVLLTVSLVSLAGSKCRRSRLEDDTSDRQVEEYLSVGK